MSEALPEPGACIFDLDGTLVDSLQDIAEAFNECLEILGLPVYPAASYRYMVGEGIPRLCERAIGRTSPHLLPRLADLAMAFYRTRVVRHTRPYAGVPELVARLRARNVRLAVLSNKPHDMTLRVVRAFWPADTFGAIYGYAEEQHRKPSPFYILRICEELGIAPADTWVVGDTPTDIEAARAGGAVPIGVTWGFRTRADLEAAGARHIVSHPGELA